MKNAIASYTGNLTLKDGIYFSRITGEISYPADGNDACFTIEDDSFWFRHRNNCIAGIVKKYAKDSLFFDIGGGNGFVSKGLEENGITTCLVEPCVYVCLNAQKRGLANVICSDLKNAGFTEGVIPAAGLFDVIEHIEDDTGFLSEVNTCMAGGGHLFVTVPAYGFLWSRADTAAGHFRRYTLRGLKKKLVLSGFELLYSTYIFQIIVPPIFLFRTVPGLLGMDKGGGDREERAEASARNGREHRVDGAGRVTDRVLRRLLSSELRRIERGRVIPFGGTCLVAAKKL